MEVRSNKGSLKYTMVDGERLPIPSLLGNTPRISGVRTGNDKVILKSNNGKLLNLQH